MSIEHIHSLLFENYIIIIFHFIGNFCMVVVEWEVVILDGEVEVALVVRRDTEVGQGVGIVAEGPDHIHQH